jgi:hypothetical protein
MEVKKYTLPSGAMVGFREANANDEGILTMTGYKETNTHITRYLQSVITSYNDKPGTLSLEEINKWGLSDKYYALILSRIVNFGTELSFQWVFNGEKNPIDMTLNLNDYLLAGHRTDDIKEDGPFAPKLYPNGSESTFEFTATSGKQFKWSLINTNAEMIVANKNPKDISILDLLKTRNLQININGEGDWIKLEDFSVLSIKDSRELRATIKANDPSYDMSVEIPHPENPNKNEYMPLPGIPDFLVPSEI